MGSNDSGQPRKKTPPYWLIYGALILSGILLLADAYSVSSLRRWTARLGIAMLYTAVSLIVGNGRTVGFVATGIVWLALILTYLL